MNPHCTRGGGIWQLDISNAQIRLKKKKTLLPQMNSYSYPGAMKEYKECILCCSNFIETA